MVRPSFRTEVTTSSRSTLNLTPTNQGSQRLGECGGGAKNNYGMKVNLIDTANYQLIKQNYFQSCSEIGQSDWLMRVTAEKGENFFPLFKKSIMLANGFINLLLCCPYNITGQYILLIH